MASLPPLFLERKMIAEYRRSKIASHRSFGDMRHKRSH
jgi:hypothetical protein